MHVIFPKMYWIEMLKITDLMSDAQCYEKLGELRWGKGPVRCPRCAGNECKEKGTSTKSSENREYRCANCTRSFNDLTGTLFAESNLSLKAWMGCLYLMNLNTSNRQIAQEPGGCSADDNENASGCGSEHG